MARTGAVTFKGTPLTLVGEELKVGQPAPEFKLHRFADGGLKEVTLKSFAGKPLLISVVPSLDTSVCAAQTKTFSDRLGALGDKVAALTVSLDLPFAQNRFCGAENIANMTWASDYQDRNFGRAYGVLIDELKLLARAIFVIDANGKLVYAENVKEVASHPDYDAAVKALEAAGK